MPQLQDLPTELLDLIIEHLLLQIGIQKAVILRPTSRTFAASILRAICDSQIVDVEDAATPYLRDSIPAELRGRILMTKAAAGKRKDHHLEVIRRVNRDLDCLLDSPSMRTRHELIAAATVPWDDESPLNPQMDAQNLLCGATVIGNLSIVEKLLAEGLANVSGHTPYFHDPLTLAAAYGHIDVVDRLLQYGASPEAVCASWHQNREIKDLTDWNSVTDSVSRSIVLSEEPPSALRSAVAGGYKDIVQLLLLSQHRLPTTSLEYLRIFKAAVSAGRLDLIEMVSSVIGKNISDFDELGNFLLFDAVQNGHRGLIQMFVDSGVSVDAAGPQSHSKHGTPLSLAAALGNEDITSLLLSLGADVNGNPWCREEAWPIVCAARCGQENIIDILLTHGADPIQAFLTAAKASHPRVIRTLLADFPDLPRKKNGEVGGRALQRAIISGNLTSITILVEAGVSVVENRGEDGYCYNPPMEVAKWVGPWVVEHLLSLGAPDNDLETEVTESSVRGVLTSERTWDWVGKY